MKLKNNKGLIYNGLTLGEIAMVIIMTGLFTSVGVYKYVEIRDRADVKYTLNAVNMINTGINSVIAREGSFPEVVGNTPEDRLRHILTHLTNRDYFVNSGLGEDSVVVDTILKTNRALRKNSPSGLPTTTEIVTLPGETTISEGRILKVALNNGSEPMAALYTNFD